MNGAFRPKGGNGVHGLFDDAAGGLFRRSLIMNTGSDYELPNFWTRSSRILHSLTCCVASIPPSADADTSLYTREALLRCSLAVAVKD